MKTADNQAELVYKIYVLNLKEFYDRTPVAALKEFH
jgi:hypothetical protein